MVVHLVFSDGDEVVKYDINQKMKEKIIKMIQNEENSKKKKVVVENDIVEIKEGVNSIKNILIDTKAQAPWALSEKPKIDIGDALESRHRRCQPKSRPSHLSNDEINNIKKRIKAEIRNYTKI